MSIAFPLTTRSSRSLLWPPCRARGARAGAEALIELSTRHGLRRVDEQLIAWMRAHGIGE